MVLLYIYIILVLFIKSCNCIIFVSILVILRIFSSDTVSEYCGLFFKCVNIDEKVLYMFS
ncbi:hypothetical protein EDL79_00415 [Ehrlichia ruminantium]|uniref:Uncharacterized protein n=1 Tax=Ehrlichia ruminantium TaxID=779 RepID=A0AAE6Q8I7_EHRRU|nr:hypothetical protein EDL81_00415 [Ehrlichia ruminantium]QGR03084.1 hypothetical protein EDL80_00415 [Ehrlichia ruminantium]QGR04009.1 hypothetical protein EDL79_00415 [Ehrlichia ruminantium]